MSSMTENCHGGLFHLFLYPSAVNIQPQPPDSLPHFFLKNNLSLFYVNLCYIYLCGGVKSWSNSQL